MTTSTIAHANHEATGTASGNREVVRLLVVHHPDSTAVELWCVHSRMQDHMNRHEISRRLPELRKAGLVHNGPARKCRVNGSLMLTWNPGPKPSTQGELF